jgi:toxin ParE1/3/4
MLEIRKRPQVIRDLIDIATYIANTNLDQSDRFLQSAEATFQNLAKMPGIGKLCQFNNSQLKNIRQARAVGCVPASFNSCILATRLSEPERINLGSRRQIPR